MSLFNEEKCAFRTARRLRWGFQPPYSPLSWLPLAAFSPFHILPLQNTRPSRRTDVRVNGRYRPKGTFSSLILQAACLEHSV